jgi:L-rhamnose isomerase
MGAVPDISGIKPEGVLGGLMDKAANYNASLKAVNELKKQFEALGLSPEMIMQVVNSAKAYLETDEGQKIKEQLMEGLNTLSL